MSFKFHFITLSAVAALTFTACQQGATTTTDANAVANINGNINGGINANTNINAVGNMVSTTATTAANTVGNVATIETREPQTYQAVLTFTAQAANQQGNTQTSPAMSAQVARDGQNRRIAAKFVNFNEEIVLLDKDGKRFLLLPTRKQYVDLAQAAGANVPAIPTPAQIVANLQSQRGVERVGEEELNGRRVTKYRYAGAASTGTPAGQTQGEAFIYVDNDTGLPLKADLFAQSSGNVQGFNAGRGVMEVRDITTNVSPDTFNIPQDYKPISGDELRQQVNQTLQIASMFLGMMNGNMTGGNMNNQNSTPTPNATPQP